MSRKCSNWLETFLEWTLPRSEAPESFLVWSGLFTVASVLKRKVFFPESKLGSYSIPPSLYVLFVGPPGVARKTTTAGYAERLFDSLNEYVGAQAVPSQRVKLGPTSGSDSQLIKTMSDIPDGAMSIVSGEFGTLMKTSPEGMYDVFSKLADNPETYTYETRMHGVEVVDNPCLNLLACTTPGWIAENPGYMLEGGFASRTIFVFESEARQRRMYYDDVDWDIMDQMERALVADLAQMAELEGEFDHEDEDLRDEMEDWYIKHVDSNYENQMSGYHFRKHVHIHKVAMLLAMCQGDRLVITRQHFQSALGLLNALEDQMPRALSAIGKNPYSSQLHVVLDFIKKVGPVTKENIQARFWHDLMPNETAEILDALLISDQVERVPGGPEGKMVYVVP